MKPRIVGLTLLALSLSVVLLLLAAVGAPAIARQANPCTLLTVDEVKSALGRTDVTAGKFIRESDDVSVCVFASSAGDVAIMLTRVNVNTQRDFDILKGITLENVKVSETISGVGDGAFFYDDELDFRVGNRMVMVSVDRTPRTEAPAAVKAALITLAKRITDRLRAAR